MQTEIVKFQNADKHTLAGTLVYGNREDPRAVIMGHGWRGNRDSERNVKLAEALAEKGIASLRIDFAGHGASEGDILEASTISEALDYIQAYHFLSLRLPFAHSVGIAGASIGGSAALYAMGHLHNFFDAAVLFSTRYDFSDVRDDMYSVGEGDEKKINTVMLEYGRRTNFYKLAGKLRIPILAIHGTDDQSIPLEQAIKFMRVKPSKFKLRQIPRGDHMLRDHVPTLVKAATEFFDKNLRL